MPLVIANKEKMTALLKAKGIQPSEDAVFEELPRCHVCYLRWKGKTGPCEACLYTSQWQPVLTFIGRRIAVSAGELAHFGMLEKEAEP